MGKRRILQDLRAGTLPMHALPRAAARILQDLQDLRAGTVTMHALTHAAARILQDLQAGNAMSSGGRGRPSAGRA